MLNPNEFSAPQELLVLGAAMETGIISALHDQPSSTPAAIAATLSLDNRATAILLDALTACGYATLDVDGYRLSPEATELLYPATGGEARFAFLHTYRQIKRWSQLADVVRSGRPVPRDLPPLFLTGFMHAMRRNSTPLSDHIAALVCANLTSPFSVLDIGGGPLVHARAFARRGATVTILDTAETQIQMESELTVAESIHFVAGDFNAALPTGPFDVAYLGNICHIYGPKENQALFQRTWHCLRPGGRIVINDFVRDIAPRAPLFGVNMLVSTENGGTWSQAEYRSWLEAAGFIQIAMQNLGDHQLFHGYRPAD